MTYLISAKPRLRFSPFKGLLVPSQDGWIKSVSVSGSARPFLPDVLANLPSQGERKVLIGSLKPALAVGSNVSRYSQNLTGSFGSRSFLQNSHVALSHGVTLSRFHSHGREK